MDIRTLWVTRKSEEMSPELIEAWDEYSQDENPAGAKESFEKALASIGSDLDEFRFITLEIPDSLIRRAFDPIVIKVNESKVEA